MRVFSAAERQVWFCGLSGCCLACAELRDGAGAHGGGGEAKARGGPQRRLAAHGRRHSSGQPAGLPAGSRLPDDAPDLPLFVALSFWLVGSMLYIWLIAFIFHRILFLPLPPGELTPPYWINMKAMAISTLAGVSLVSEASRMPLLTKLLPFLKGMTLLFWATGTWWIPILLALGLAASVQACPTYLRARLLGWCSPWACTRVCTQNLIGYSSYPFLTQLRQFSSGSPCWHGDGRLPA